MEYRGFEYNVVQTITNAWRWSVKRENEEKTGIVGDRATGVFRG